MLLLAALPLAMAQCGKITEPEPDASPSGNTVTLTLRGAETVSTPDSKTSLAGNGQVLWSEGDYVTVGTPTSLETYPVIPDPENPAMATIEGVPQSDEYVVAYPSIPEDWQYGEIGEFVTVGIDSYQRYAENSFASEENPMVGYGASTDIELRNVASVARFGITGTGAVSYLAFAANDGSNIAGNIRIPVEDLRSGKMDDSYSDFSSEYGTSIALDCLDEEENPAPVQLSSEPVWFHLVVPAKTYETGFTLYVMDSERNLAAKKMTVPVTMPRSTVVAVEPASTETAGEGPAILDFSVLPESTYSKLVMNVALEGEVSALKLGLFAAAEYDAYLSSGLKPRDMALAYGTDLDESLIDAAVSGGLNYETDFDDRIYPSTEYRLVLLATGSDGAESVMECSHFTAEHFPANASWEQISSDATVTMQDYDDGWTLQFNGLEAEQLAGENIYRIRLDIYQNDFSGYMTSLGCTPDGDGEVYLYIDGNTEADIFGSGMPEPVAQIFPQESYVPFATGDGLPVYFHSSGYTMINEWDTNISIDIHTVLTPDYIADITLAYQHLSIYIPVQAAPVNGSMSNEDFVLQEETPWD